MTPAPLTHPSPGQQNAFWALTLSRIALRNDLRALIEADALASLTTHPKPGLLSAEALASASEKIDALRAINTVMIKPAQDQHPAWLDDVIDGRIKL